ncbi:MAG: flagellar motor protein MotB [Microthrixaceae bacterium]
MSKKKRHHHEEHEEHVNHEAWVIPYADMLTLLMALFLIMWASGRQDVAKMRMVATGFADSLGITNDGPAPGGKGVLDGTPNLQKASADPEIKPRMDALTALQEAQRIQQQQLVDLQRSITGEAHGAGVDAELAFKTETRGLVVSIASEGVLFDPGSDELRPEGRRVLDGLANQIRVAPNKVSIEGHTDDRPIATSRFPSNWELSTARATAVLRYLVGFQHADPAKLSASGYGDQQPAAPNDSEAGRARNRRVDIAFLSEPIDADTIARATKASSPTTRPPANAPPHGTTSVPGASTHRR